MNKHLMKNYDGILGERFVECVLRVGYFWFHLSQAIF